MKTTMLTVSAVLVCAFSYSQTQNNDYKSMIDSAIVMQRAAYKPDIYLIDEKDQPYTLSSDKAQEMFNYIFLYEKQNRKRLKKGINAWKILPVLNGNRLTINIIDFIITYKKRNYAFGNGGGATIVFEYSCHKKEWVLVKSSWSGN